MQKINKISKKGLVILSVLTGLNYYNVNAQISCATIGNVSCGFGTEYLG